MGVMVEKFGTESGAVEMDVDFGGGDRFMPQHFLDGTQVGAPFQKMGGERVAQRVGAYLFHDSGRGRKIPDYVEHHHPCHFFPSAVEQQYVLAPFADIQLVAFWIIFGDK